MFFPSLKGVVFVWNRYVELRGTHSLWVVEKVQKYDQNGEKLKVLAASNQKWQWAGHQRETATEDRKLREK